MARSVNVDHTERLLTYVNETKYGKHSQCHFPRFHKFGFTRKI